MQMNLCHMTTEGRGEIIH